MISILSNDSLFGKIMNRCGIVIALNIMFIIFSIPIISAGASYAALYYASLRTVKGKWDVNPFKEFWNGFKTNFKQGTIAEVIIILFGLFLVLDLRICLNAQGMINTLKIPVFAILIIFFVTILFLFPTMAAFENKLSTIIMNGIYFAIKNPIKTLIIIVINIIPIAISYIDINNQPLYAFIWFFFGAALITMIESKLLWPEYEKHMGIFQILN